MWCGGSSVSCVRRAERTRTNWLYRIPGGATRRIVACSNA